MVKGFLQVEIIPDSDNAFDIFHDHVDHIPHYHAFINGGALECLCNFTFIKKNNYLNHNGI